MPRSLRLPSDLEEAIKRLAKEHDRSENAEIIVAVRQYVKSQEDYRDEPVEEEIDICPDCGESQHFGPC